MRKRSKIWLGGAALVLLAGCNRAPSGEQAGAQPPPPTPGENAAPEAAPPASSTAAGGAALTDRDGKPVPLVPFDTGSVPLSTAALGELPFFSLPQGYAPQNAPHPRAWARFPFRMGEGVHWVEGPSWSARIVADSEAAPDKTFSALEVQRNFDGVITAAGGRKVFEGTLLRDIYYGPQLEGEIGGGFIDAVNGEQDAPTTVYVLRQANRTVWLQLAVDSNGAGLVVVDEVPFRPPRSGRTASRTCPCRPAMATATRPSNVISMRSRSGPAITSSRSRVVPSPPISTRVSASTQCTKCAATSKR